MPCREHLAASGCHALVRGLLESGREEPGGLINYKAQRRCLDKDLLGPECQQGPAENSREKSERLAKTNIHMCFQHSLFVYNLTYLTKRGWFNAPCNSYTR